MAEDKRPGKDEKRALGEKGKMNVIRCPVCKCEGPFIMNQRLGAIICKGCGVFFMNDATRKELYKQAQSQVILPSGGNILTG